MRLLLVRHAQSLNNVAAREERYRTDVSVEEMRENFERRRVEDPALSQLGTQQAEALASYLAADNEIAAYADLPVCVYCSPMQRTILTAEPLLQRFSKWRGVIDDRIFEVGGLFSRCADGTEKAGAGATPDELLVGFGTSFELCDELNSLEAAGRGWNRLCQRETKAQATARAKQISAWILRMASDGAPMVVMVIHGDLLGYMLRELLSTDVRFLHYNTATTALELAGGRWTVLHQNRCSHLSGDDKTGEEMLAVVS